MYTSSITSRYLKFLLVVILLFCPTSKIFAITTTGEMFSSLANKYSGSAATFLGLLSKLDVGEKYLMLILMAALLLAIISVLMLWASENELIKKWAILPIVAMSVCESVGILSTDIMSLEGMVFILMSLVGIGQISLTIYYYFKYFKGLDNLIFSHAIMLFIPTVILAISFAFALEPLIDIVFWIWVIIHVIFMVISFRESEIIYSTTSLFLLLPILLISTAIGIVLLIIFCVIVGLGAILSKSLQ